MKDEAKESDVDAALMKRIGNNDVDAYRIIVNKYLSRAINFVERMIGNRNDAEDLAQEAFLKVWKEAARWRANAKFTTWFHRVLYNLCIDHLRKSRLMKGNAGLEDVRSKIPTAEESLISREVSEQVKTALQKLPERQRAALILFYYDGLKQNEAAEVLEVSVSALEALLFRSRTTLRGLLKDLYDDNTLVEE